MRSNGSEPVEGPRGPSVQPPTRPEERVIGISKAAKAKNKEERENLAALERRYSLWMKASDISSLEVDKLRRQIARLKASLLPEKKKVSRKKRRRG